jgi:L-2-hydroxyglutarate oxidase
MRLMSTGQQRVAVVGAGLVGLAVGRQLAHAGHDITVFDKEPDVAMHQSGHNSGVVHSGIYYAPGSLKATLCRRGVELIHEFCAEHGLEYREIGKVVVARDDLEVARLSELE